MATPRMERLLPCNLPLRVVASYVREAWLRRLRVGEKQYFANTARCGPVIRSQLMTVIVSSVLDGTEMSHELVEQVNKQIGHPFLPGALDELVAVLREVNVDDTVIAAAEAARLPREPEEATIR